MWAPLIVVIEEGGFVPLHVWLRRYAISQEVVGTLPHCGN
jgi:hypothetical protein